MPGECLNTDTALSGTKYTFVAVDIDTTGKRLIDEVRRRFSILKTHKSPRLYNPPQIIQLSAYTPKKQFSQYIMPYMNLNQAAKMKHQLRVINLGIFRMLKNMQTHKVIKTKTEYAVLKEFLDWLEEVKSETAEEEDTSAAESSHSTAAKGIVLVFHEQRQFIPCMLLGALKR